MLTVEQALEAVGRACGVPRASTEDVGLADALGRVLAADVRMDHDVPPFRRATMDGFAARRPDVTVGATLEVAGTVMAGDVPAAPVAPGTVHRVMTGAPVPEGTEVVLPFEWTTERAGAVEVVRLSDDAAHIVEPGAHVRRGDVVVRAGTLLGPAHLGALASAGRARVGVASRPTVAVLGTGSELVGIDETPGPGRIRNSNSAALLGQVRRAGAVPRDLGFAVDDADALRAALRDGLACDVLLVSGGVSRGDLDLVPRALEAEGVEPVFHHWAVQPGGPLWFGVHEDTLVFGLPGNPAATYVGFEVLVVPALATRLGLGLTPRPTWHARYRGPWGRPGPRRRYRPVRLTTEADGRLVAEAVPWKGSGDPFGLAAGDALVALPEGLEAPVGDVVPVIPLCEAARPWGRA